MSAAQKISYFGLIRNGIFGENPVFRVALSLCPAVAVTNTLKSGLLMGVAVFFVQVMANISISIVRKLIHARIRLPAYILIIGTWVTVANLLLAAYEWPIYKEIGLYVELIVAFAIILSRAELFASKNEVVPSLFDGLGMGLGFMFALGAISFVRELLGNGALMGYHVVNTHPVLLFALPMGGFFAVGLLMGFFNWIDIRFFGGHGASGAGH
ncbi:MAG: electron transport complex subunit RsxE [Actinomycetota bacterium]|nr:electron transport complex subunit RsxE [Actinomycetota bacterium]